MTRDEARAIVKAIVRELWNQPRSDNSSADFYIDLFVKFGAMELVEPLSPAQRLHDTIGDTPLANKFVDFMNFVDKAGLKLVNK